VTNTKRDVILIRNDNNRISGFWVLQTQHPRRVKDVVVVVVLQVVLHVHMTMTCVDFALDSS